MSIHAFSGGHDVAASTHRAGSIFAGDMARQLCELPNDLASLPKLDSLANVVKSAEAISKAAPNNMAVASASVHEGRGIPVGAGKQTNTAPSRA